MLQWIRRFLIVVLMILSLVAGITFTGENNQPLVLILFGHSLPELAFGFWLILALFLGIVCGFLPVYLCLLWTRRSRLAKERKLRQLQKEFDQFKVVGSQKIAAEKQ